MNQDLVDEKIFYEIQQFRQIWIWLIILIVVIVLSIPIISGVLNIFLSIVFFLFGFGFIWLFYSMKLVTEVKEVKVEVPGETIVVEKEIVKTVEVPGDVSEVIKTEINVLKKIGAKIITKRNKMGNYILVLDKGNAFLKGAGYSKKGQFPFVDQINLFSNNLSSLSWVSFFLLSLSLIISILFFTNSL